MNINTFKKAADYLGRYGEILATLYMMHEGYFVTQLGNANKKHDLLCEDEDGKIISVQVKTVSNSNTRNRCFNFQLYKSIGINGKCHGSTAISNSDFFILICYMRESGRFYIHKYTNKYLKDRNMQTFCMHTSDLHEDNLFITKKLPNFSDDFDEDLDVLASLIAKALRLVKYLPWYSVDFTLIETSTV